jgi:hypothetical protein
MQECLFAAVLVVILGAPVLAGETYYIVHDNTLNGCTILTAEPTDQARYKVMGRYNSEAEAEKAIISMKGC